MCAGVIAHLGRPMNAGSSESLGQKVKCQSAGRPNPVVPLNADKIVAEAFPPPSFLHLSDQRDENTANGS